MKSWAPVIVALLGFGTAVVQTQHATEAESRSATSSKESAALREAMELASVAVRGMEPCADLD